MGKIFDIFFKDSEVAIWDTLKENWIMITIGIIALALIITLSILLYKKNRNSSAGEKTTKKPLFDIHSLTFAAMCLALAFVLSYIKIINLPQGGGVTPVSMLPIILFAYIYGPKRGFIVSFVYFILQLLQGIYFLNVVQFFFDYVLAFTIIGIAGFFKKNLLMGVISAHLLRYMSHVIAAYAFFREYNATGINDTAYCLIYNSFVLIEMVACIIIVVIPPVKKNFENMKMKLSKSVR